MSYIVNDYMTAFYMTVYNNSFYHKFNQERLYHYTSFNTAKKIFLPDGLSFRMTNATWFDDKNEGKIFYEVYHDIINRLFMLNYIDIRFYKLLCRFDKESLHYDNANDYSQTSKNFVGCFSNNPDNNYLWNYVFEKYQDDTLGGGACSFGFDACFFNGANMLNLSKEVFVAASTPNRITALTHKVIYDKNEQSNRVEVMLYHLYQLYCKFGEYYNNSTILALSEIIDRFKLLFKDTTYIPEDETRFILSVPKESEQYDNFKDKSYFEYKVPYNLINNLSITINSKDAESAEKMQRYFSNINNDWQILIK